MEKMYSGFCLALFCLRFSLLVDRIWYFCLHGRIAVGSGRNCDVGAVVMVLGMVVVEVSVLACYSNGMVAYGSLAYGLWVWMAWHS